MPHTRPRIIRGFLFAASLLLVSLLGLPSFAAGADATGAVTLTWHEAPAGHVLSANENISRFVHWTMNAVLQRLAAGRADPVTILEDRSQTIEGDSHGTCVLVKEDDVRRYGGDHPKDASIKRRTAQALVQSDPSGRFSPLPPLASAESAAHQSPSPQVSQGSGCSAQAYAQTPADMQPYNDAGDAALAEFPNHSLSPGDTWSFTRPVRVERELASGVMTYTNVLDHVEDRAGHRIAIITVKGLGRIDPVKDLQDKGFKTASMVFTGTAEFDLHDGLPLTQRYTGHIEWMTHILGARVGLIVDETYVAKPWSIKRQS